MPADIQFPVTTAPMVNVQGLLPSAQASISSATQNVFSSAGSANLSLGSITSQAGSSAVSVSTSGFSVSAAPAVSSLLSGGGISQVTSVSGLVAKAGVPTSAAGVASAIGINTNMSTTQAFQTLGVNLSASQLGFDTKFVSGIADKLNLSSMKLPGNIPGLDYPGLMLGAGPKFIADTLLKYKTIIPPFVPGLKINMAMVGAAISIAKAAASGNAGDIVKSLLEDLKESTGVSDLQEQINDKIQEAKDTIGLTDLQNKFDDLQNTIANPGQALEENFTSQVQAAASEASPASTTSTSLIGSTSLLGQATQTINTAAQSVDNTVQSAASSLSFPPKG